MEGYSTIHIPLQKQSNFRDLGGFETADGWCVKPGLMYRSGELSNLTEEDLQRLQELGIKTIVDLRSENEVNMFGEDQLPEGAGYLALRIEPGNWSSGLFDVVTTGDISHIPDDILALTNRLIIRDATEQISTIFKLLADPDNLPLAFHCTSGKDRTGMVAAVILMTLGVSQDLALADYLKSNEYLKEVNETQIEGIRMMIAAQMGIDPADVDVSKFNQLFYQEPAYFEAALDEIDQQYGSFENYLHQGLGIDDAQLQNFREQFLTSC
ncbi:MAG: tyrosine-protein phosphatase [Candidatus Promineifilaceae bacterium]